MTASLQERAALITGGSRGIGREIAQRLAAGEYAVAIAYRGNAAEAAETVESITGQGGRAIAVQADVAEEAAVEAAFAQAEQAFGGLDVVVNAA
jgi:3-oxoacyl-[acyl-carrier protein] reductase